MTNAPPATVTVVIAAHDAAGWVAPALKSLRTQRFGSWHAVVWADDLRAGIVAAARRAAGSDPRIVVVRTPDGDDPALARNAGLAMAQGDWVLFLDAGARLEPDHLTGLVGMAARYCRADVVHCDWRDVGADGRSGPRRRADLSPRPGAALAASCDLPLHAALMRRTKVAEVGGFAEARGAFAAWDLMQRLAAAGALFRRSPDVVADRILTPAAPNAPYDLGVALSVIRQGHDLAGLGVSNRRRAETGMTIRLAGQALGAGQDAGALLAALGAGFDPNFDAAGAAEALMDGVATGMSDALPDWPTLWPRLAPRLRDVLGLLEPRMAMPAFTDLAMRVAEQRIVRDLPVGADTTVGGTVVRTFDLSAPPPEVSVPPGTQRLAGIVCAQGQEAGRFEVAPTGDLTADGMEAVLADFAPSPRDPEVVPEAAEDAIDTREAGYWEGIFGSEDPWAYDNPYEALKYDQTLEAIPAGLGIALELACAEGHFTRRLAARVGHLMATDISPTAVERARRRCAGLDNVSFGVLNLLTDPMPGALDLIVCSEVLYYFDDPGELTLVADRIAAALRPGGYLVTTHANLVHDGDEPHSAGFTWNHPFGARTIGAVFAESGDLALVEERRSDLYRVQVFRRRVPSVPPAPPRILAIPQSDRIPARVATYIDWAGRPPPGTPEPRGVPVLMYHRVVDDPLAALARYAIGPETFRAQMGWLAEQGYTTISLDMLEAAIWDAGPLPDRPVAVTFDDGYRDTLRYALPVLRDFGQTATIFIPTDHVGGTAAWDRIFGTPAPLMGWDELEVMRDAGIGIASHGRSHRPLAALSPDGLAEELGGSRVVLADRFGPTVRHIAYPYGNHDEAVERAALAAGYRLAFTTQDRRWRPGDRVMAAPRVEIHRGLSLDGFAARVRAA